MPDFQLPPPALMPPHRAMLDVVTTMFFFCYARLRAYCLMFLMLMPMPPRRCQHAYAAITPPCHAMPLEHAARTGAHALFARHTSLLPCLCYAACHVFRARARHFSFITLLMLCHILMPLLLPDIIYASPYFAADCRC